MGIWIRRPWAAASGAGDLDANRRWKQGWERWVARSVGVAVVAHVLVFALWPVWNVTMIPRAERAEIVQLEWIPFYGADSAPEGVPLAAMPSADELELLIEEAGAVERADAEEDVAEALAERLTSLTFPEPRTASSNPVAESGAAPATPPADAMILEELLVARPEVVSLISNSPWPLLRNPTVVSRYIASRRNQPERQPAESRPINVLVGIDSRGTVEWVQIVDSTGLQSLDDLALSIFREVAVFAPAQERGRSVPITLLISMRL